MGWNYQPAMDLLLNSLRVWCRKACQFLVMPQLTMCFHGTGHWWRLDAGNGCHFGYKHIKALQKFIQLQHSTDGLISNTCIHNKYIIFDIYIAHRTCLYVHIRWAWCMKVNAQQIQHKRFLKYQTLGSKKIKYERKNWQNNIPKTQKKEEKKTAFFWNIHNVNTTKPKTNHSTPSKKRKPRSLTVSKFPWQKSFFFDCFFLTDVCFVFLY